MPLFKKKVHQPSATSDDRALRGTQQFELYDPRASSCHSPLSPHPLVPQSPQFSQYSPRGSTTRSTLRSSYDAIAPAYAVSPHSHAAYLIAQSANTGNRGSYHFMSSSPSSPAFHQGSAEEADPRASSRFGRDGLSASISLPQIDPRAEVYYKGLFPPPAAYQHLPNPYDSPGISPNSPRSSTSSVRPLRVVKAPPFPFPTEAVALHTLARVLRTETKKFRITDFIDTEEGQFAALVEAQEREKLARQHPNENAPRRYHSRVVRKSMWDGEEEYETVTDCVRDKMEDEGAGASRWKSERMERSEKRKREREMRLKDLHLFGTHLEDLPDFALSPVIVGGYLHEVPTAMAAAIEELVTARLKQHNFFSSRPDRKQLFDLVNRFDQLVTANVSYGRLVPPPPLHQESTESIYSLLVTYLSALPHTIIPRALVDALWCWCVSPSITRAHRAKTVRSHSADASETERESSEEEDNDEMPDYAERLRQREREFLDLPSFRVQVRIARHVLLLLSRRQFSLLLYLMTFIRAVLRLNCESDEEDGDRTSNGVGLHDIARAFGGVMLGGKDWKRRSSIKHRDGSAATGDRDRTTKEQKIMTWLVNHWERIASAYEADDTPGEKLGEEARARAASLPMKKGSIPPESLERSNAAASPSYREQCTSPSQRPSVPYPGGKTKQEQLARGIIPPECESLTSGSTASSSDWEELPIVSARIENTGKIHPREKMDTRKQVPSGSSEGIEDTDILDYYSGGGRERTSGMSGSEVKASGADSDDDSSVYSCDDLKIALGKPDTVEASQSSSQRARGPVSVHSPAAEIEKLRSQLQAALDERDDARKLVHAMRNVVVDAQL